MLSYLYPDKRNKNSYISTTLVYETTIHDKKNKDKTIFVVNINHSNYVEH